MTVLASGLAVQVRLDSDALLFPPGKHKKHGLKKQSLLVKRVEIFLNYMKHQNSHGKLLDFKSTLVDYEVAYLIVE